MTNEMRSIPQVRATGFEERAEEISNGTLTLDQLGSFDREGCWLAAEDEAISMAERRRVQGAAGRTRGLLPPQESRGSIDERSSMDGRIEHGGTPRGLGYCRLQ